MPIYEYDCRGCNERVEVLLRRQDEQPECPQCGGRQLERLMSVTAAPASGSGRSLPMSPGPAESCGMPRCCGGGCAE